MSTHCKGETCGAEIRWAVNVASGKRVPVDPGPVPDGPLVMDSIQVGGDLKVRFLKRGETTGMPRYNPHHRTCPDAEAYRKAKPGQARML